MQATTAVEQDIGSELYALVVFLHKRCTPELFEAIGALDLSITQVKLLGLLDGLERALTLKEAGERVGVSIAAASRVVDDLVRRSLVERHEDADDRRMKRISITSAGRAMIGRVNASRLESMRAFVQTLSPSEREALLRALTPLLARPEIAACRPTADDEAATGQPALANEVRGLPEVDRAISGAVQA